MFGVPSRAIYEAAKFGMRHTDFRNIDIDPRGTENIPRTGALVLSIAPHFNELDVPGFGLSIRRPINYVAKHTLDVGKKGWVYEQCGAMYIVRPKDRDSDVETRKDTTEYPKGLNSLNEAKRRLGRGWAVGIFPEGMTEGHDGRLGEFSTGMSDLVVETGAQLVCAGIGYDTYNPDQEITRMCIEVGSPIDVAAIFEAATNRREQRRAITEAAYEQTQVLFDTARQRATP